MAGVQAQALADEATAPVLPPLAYLQHVQDHLRDASDTHDLDVELLQALIVVESGFNASAISSAGAVGLMQIMPATAANFGVRGDKNTSIRTKLSDPGINIHLGGRYLRYLLQLFSGELELALAAYKAGEGTVRRAGNQMPKRKETRDYVNTVMQLYGALKLSAAPPAVLSPSDLSPTPTTETDEFP